MKFYNRLRRLSKQLLGARTRRVTDNVDDIQLSAAMPSFGWPVSQLVSGEQI